MNFELGTLNCDVLVVAALRSEVAGIMERARVCLVGVGIHGVQERLEQELQAGHAPGLILSVGLSGSLDESLATGHLVIASEVVFGETRFPARHLETPGIVARRGPIYCSPRTVSAREERLEIGRSSGALCVDMESGAVARVAEAHRIPMAALRAIMDSVDDPVAGFDSPRDAVDRACVRERIRLDLSGPLGEKARRALAQLDSALHVLLGLPHRTA
ncbi:MAG: hypothetical protein HYX75_23570 [Acidobacteria bacterium]|nr:hypothetical protein [Acidobacteriota bacterium]